MIYGLVPVGGKGTRLGLPFPKELLPQRGTDHYVPIIHHTVQKMLDAGADRIVFVHGVGYKTEIVEHYSDVRMIHVVQAVPGFATVLKDFFNAVELVAGDQVLFGLPDTIYDGNLFVEMLRFKGVACGLFVGPPSMRVDRLRRDNAQAFQVKSAKESLTQKWFWGVLKFDASDIEDIVNGGLLDSYTEIGDILNQYTKVYIRGGHYIDTGTWETYNAYLRGVGNLNTGVYIIRNTVNAKCYIGSAVDFNTRWASHKSQLNGNKHHSLPLQNAFNKYGASAFEMGVLCFCHKRDLVQFEQKFIDQLKPEYNVCPVAGSTLGRKHTEEAKAKISARAAGRVYSDEYKKNMAETCRGRRHTEESKAKMSEACKDRPHRTNSEATRAKISAANKGRKNTEETKARMSEAAKKRWRKSGDPNA